MLNDYKLFENISVPGRPIDVNIPPKFPPVTTVTMSYTPFQQDNTTYPLETAFAAGTAFPCLDKPFLGGSGK